MAHEGVVSPPFTMQTAATATGNGLVLNTTGREWLLITVSGISGDTITVEGHIDDSNWETLRVLPVDSVESLASITANNTYIVRVGGQRGVRARISTFSAGTITVTAVMSSVPPFPIGYGAGAGRWVKSITLTPTITTTAYAVLDNLGGEQTLASAVRSTGGGGVIESIVLADKSENKTALDIVFFNADPAGTYTDNGTTDITDADLFKIIGVVEIGESDYIMFTDNYIVSMNNLGLAFRASGSTSLYALIISRGTPTYAVGDLQLIVSILQD